MTEPLKDKEPDIGGDKTRKTEKSESEVEYILLKHSGSWVFDEDAKEIAGYGTKKLLAETLSRNGYKPNVTINVSAELGPIGYEVHISIDGKIFTGVHMSSELTAFNAALLRIETAPNTNTDISEYMVASNNWNLPKELNTKFFKASLARILKEKGYKPNVTINVSAELGPIGYEARISIDGEIFTGVHTYDTERAFLNAISHIK